MATFYIDGGSVGNQKKGIPRRARIAIVYQPGSGPTATTGPRVLVEEVGDRTNNEAEYLALLKLLSLLEAKWTGPDGRSSHQTEPIRILSDSELIVNQVRGDYKVKEERLSRLRDEVLKILEKSPSITIEWIPRKENLAGMWLEGLLRAKQVSAGELLSDRNG